MALVKPSATPPIDEAAYAAAYPYYVELCALSELRKKPGFGAEIYSGIGGHCLLYLNGVRVNRSAGYPVLELCPPEDAPGDCGAGISVNSHYRNANWVAFEGAKFVWHGALGAGERLTREAYTRTQEAAKASGMLDGIRFHEHFFAEKPKGMTELDYMYEISVATDYAVCFGRDTYRARAPLDALRMGAIVDYLNGLNVPYRQGKRDYRWRLFNDNCVHVAYNALAQAGVLPAWPTGQSVALAMLKFPVPKNGFVDLMLRTNDLPLANPAALFKDPVLRAGLFETDRLPAGPGALAVAGPAIRDNEVYDTEKLRLIFFDNPFWGPYRFHFDRIFSEPRYFDMKANLLHFKTLYEAAGVAQMPQSTSEQQRFYQDYSRYIAMMREELRAMQDVQPANARLAAALA